jgi:hypothetical protein
MLFSSMRPIVRLPSSAYRILDLAKHYKGGLNGEEDVWVGK